MRHCLQKLQIAWLPIFLNMAGLPSGVISWKHGRSSLFYLMPERNKHSGTVRHFNNLSESPPHATDGKIIACFVLVGLSKWLKCDCKLWLWFLMLFARTGFSGGISWRQQCWYTREVTLKAPFMVFDLISKGANMVSHIILTISYRRHNWLHSQRRCFSCNIPYMLLVQDFCNSPVLGSNSVSDSGPLLLWDNTW